MSLSVKMCFMTDCDVQRLEFGYSLKKTGQANLYKGTGERQARFE
jgi:hypothetical protein